MKILSIIFIASALIASCANKKNVTETSASETPKTELAITSEDFISLNRSGCYGTCPIYQFKVFGNGNVVYYGRQFVDKLGIFNGKLSEADTKQFFEVANSINIFSFPDQYPIDNVDFPQFVFEYQRGENIKTIRGNTNTDESLIKLTLYLDSLLEKVVFEEGR